MPSLRDLQLRFFEAVTGGSKTDARLLAGIEATAGFDASERVGVYAAMYRARLTDVLSEDFSRVLAVLGDDRFHALARAYLTRHPSTTPSVRHVGRGFVDFVAGNATLPPFLGDLARLEWARVCVFDAADAEPLSLDALRRVDPTLWPTMRLHAIPACSVVECLWPAHEIWAAAGDGDDRSPIRAAPVPTAIRVWREGFAVSHASMGQAERRAFAALRLGASFAAICEAAAAVGVSEETAAAEVGGLLLRWIEDGIVARIGA